MFPLRFFLYNFALDNSNHVFSAWQVGGKVSVVKSETENLFQNNHENSLSLLFCHSVPCILINSFWCLNPFSKYQSISLAALEDAWSEVWSVTVWWYLPHSPDIYLLISGYLLRTPDSSNFFRFPLKVRVIGSRLYSINCALVFEVFEGNSNIFILKRC